MKNKQVTLSGTGFEKFSKTTRRAQFLAEMERVVPWAELCALVEPVYPKGEGLKPGTKVLIGIGAGARVVLLLGMIAVASAYD